MPWAFNPWPLEINGNGGLKREHLELATKSITTMSMAAILGRLVTYHEGLPPTHKIT